MLRVSGKLKDDHAVASAYQPKISATLLDPDAFTTLGDASGVMAVWGVYGAPGVLTVGAGQGFANATVVPKSLEWSQGGIAELQVEFLAKFTGDGTLGTAPTIPATQAFINEAYRAKSVTIGAITSESLNKVSMKWEAEVKGNPEFKPQSHYTEKATRRTADGRHLPGDPGDGERPGEGDDGAY